MQQGRRSTEAYLKYYIVKECPPKREDLPKGTGKKTSNSDASPTKLDSITEDRVDTNGEAATVTVMTNAEVNSSKIEESIDTLPSETEQLIKNDTNGIEEATDTEAIDTLPSETEKLIKNDTNGVNDERAGLKDELIDDINSFKTESNTWGCFCKDCVA